MKHQSPLSSTAQLLEIRDLRVTFQTKAGKAEAICGVNLTLQAGEVLGIVGESGSGKSVTMMALLQLLPQATKIEGSIKFQGRELIGMSPVEMSKLRGARIGMIFQDPLTAFNPVRTIGQQITEAIYLHDRTLSKRELYARAVDLLTEVSIPQPDKRVHQYPHEFSGGMRQRAMIAMAIANKPDLLIADEPTTALDVTVQAQIMDLLDKLRVERNIGLVLITHDLGVVAGSADQIAVMYSGRIVEHGNVRDVFRRASHPYTQGLLAALPKLNSDGNPLVAIEGTPPSLRNRPMGCSFYPRCAHGIDICSREIPALIKTGNVERACHIEAHLLEQRA